MSDDQRTVNVDDYGAVGDGVTDDSAAIQAALNAAVEQGVNVRVSSKTYRLSPLTEMDEP